MKSMLLSTLLLVLAFTTKAQNTTQEEFNYMSKGFARMVNEGLDLKKGYYLCDTARFTVYNDKYRFNFYNLKRSSDKSLAGTIAVVRSIELNKTYYLGIPAANKNGSIDLNPTLMSQISDYDWSFSIRSAFLLAMSEYFMLLNTARANREK